MMPITSCDIEMLVDLFPREVIEAVSTGIWAHHTLTGGLSILKLKTASNTCLWDVSEIEVMFVRYPFRI